MSVTLALPAPLSRFGTGAGALESELVASLGPALQQLAIRHCLWKGYDRLERVQTAQGDVDLLIDRAHAPAFTAAMHAMGFKPAVAPPDRQISGIASYLGLDASLGRLVHVHVHHRVVIGHAWERHYDLGCEQAVLDHAVPGGLFRVPSPAFAWALFVIRQTLRHSAADVWRRGDPDWLTTLQPAIAQLPAATERGAVLATLSAHLPDVPFRLFERCAALLEPGLPGSARVLARRELERALAAGRMRPPLRSYARRAGALAARALRRRPVWAHPRKRLAAGGAIIALVGADGAGKSTAATALLDWLGGELETRHAHLGRPPRSWRTLLAGGALKVGRALHAAAPFVMTRGALAHLELLRSLALGRDRYRLYVAMRRFALGGGLAVCERYPLPEDRSLVGPSGSQGIATGAHGLLAWILRRMEWRYYAHIARPDHVFVLTVDPDTAVRRKTDEPADYVRARAESQALVDWSRGGNRAARYELVDATRDRDTVIADLEARLWRAL